MPEILGSFMETPLERRNDRPRRPAFGNSTARRVASGRDIGAIVVGPQRYPPYPVSILSASEQPGSLARQCAGRVFVGSAFFAGRRARTREIAAYSTTKPMPKKTAVCIVM